MYHPISYRILQQILDNVPEHKQADPHFMQRLAAHFHTIYSLAKRIYASNHDSTVYLKKIVEVMVNGYVERSKRLKQLDEDRIANPHWFTSQQWVGMMLYVDRFCGNLKTFESRLDYLADLGVNLVHLMPLLKCPKDNNDGGYAVSDYKRVNPDLGSMKDLQNVAENLHKKGSLLTLDLALNHTSEEHEWAQKALAGDTYFQQFYYMYENREIPDQFEKTMPQVFPQTAPGNFTFRPEIDKWVMTVFHNYQWDLNYSNPDVFASMLDILLFLANQGVDIIRLDALAFTWKKVGTSCQNLEEAHLLIRFFKACTQVVAPGTLFLAEAIVAPHEIVRYFGESDVVSNECDLAYNASLMTLLWESIATKNNRLLLTALRHNPVKPSGTTWLNYVRCHDDIGLGYEDEHARWAGYDGYAHRRFIIDFLTGNHPLSFAQGQKFMEDAVKGDARISGSLASLAGLEKALNEKDGTAVELAIRRIIMLHAIVLSYGGIPMLYMGDELGLINDYSYQKDPAKKHDNRWIHRPLMDWDKLNFRKNKEKIEGKIFAQLAHLIAIRKSSPVFADESLPAFIDCRNEHLFAFNRQLNDFKTLCVFNLNDHPEPLYQDVLANQGFDLVKGVRDRITDKTLNFLPYNHVMQPYEVLWISQL